MQLNRDSAEFFPSTRKTKVTFYYQQSWLASLQEHFVRAPVLAENLAEIDAQFVEGAQFGGCENADAVLFPVILNSDAAHSTWFKAMRSNLLELSRDLGLPLVVYITDRDLYEGGDEFGFGDQHVVLLPYNVIASLRTRQYVIRPYFFTDPGFDESSEQLTKIAQQKVVSFLGFSPPFGQPRGLQRWKDYFRFQLSRLERFGIKIEHIIQKSIHKFSLNYAHRTSSIASCKRDKRIRDNFSFRPGGAHAGWSKKFVADKEMLSREFLQNLRSGLFSICSRGTENYAIRFYETLSLGRIPVLVDTDIALPFDNVIDYSRHCVIVPREFASRTSDFIVSWLSKRSDEDLISIMQANRRLWEEALSPVGFHRRLHDFLCMKKQFAKTYAWKQ